MNKEIIEDGQSILEELELGKVKARQHIEELENFISEATILMNSLKNSLGEKTVSKQQTTALKKTNIGKRKTEAKPTKTVDTAESLNKETKDESDKKNTVEKSEKLESTIKTNDDVDLWGEKNDDSIFDLKVPGKDSNIDEIDFGI